MYFSLTLVGYDVDDESTDHLEKFVKAPSLESLNEFLEVNNLDHFLEYNPEELVNFADTDLVELEIDETLKPSMEIKDKWREEIRSALQICQSAT